MLRLRLTVAAVLMWGVLGFTGSPRVAWAAVCCQTATGCSMEATVADCNNIPSGYPFPGFVCDLNIMPPSCVPPPAVPAVSWLGVVLLMASLLIVGTKVTVSSRRSGRV